MAKSYFKENNIKYTDYDVSTDKEKVQEAFDKSDHMSIPETWTTM